MLHPKRKLLSLGSLALTGCILAGMLPNTHAAPEPDTLTIASYNIAGNMAIPSQLLAQDMTSHGVDIAGLQEVDKLTSRNNHDVPVEIAQEMGEEYSSFFGKSIDFGGGEYGNAIVSRYEFQDTDHALFPDNGYEGRSWSKVVVEVDGKSIAFYNTHLAYETTEARLAQIEELIQIVDADPTPYKVITGDFNTDQSTTEFYSFLYNYNLANGHNNEWIDTYAGYDPNMKTNAIDNIITTRNMRLVEVDTYRREEGKTSDHRMLYATYELLDEEVPSTQLLDIRIQEAQDLLTQSDAYTPETVTALREALDQALQGTKETQEQINALVRPLEQAIDGLEEMVEPAVPVAYYSFDDGSTRDLIADSHGEDQGNPAYVDSFSAQAGKALDTTNGYVSIEKVNDAFRWGTGDASIAFWFKASDLDYSWMIGDKDWSSGANPGFGVCCYKSYNNANRFYSSFADNSRNRTEQQTTNTLDYINDGQWHHIAATLDRDGDSLLYVDGQQVASATTNPASTGDATSSLPFCIGADSKGNYRTKAQYDEVKVYHEALTPEQVALAAELPHTHQATQVEEKAATCTQDGNIAYWYCADCGKYFSDEACTVEITLEDTVVAATGHHYENGVCVDCGEKEPDHGQANKTLLQKTYEYALTLSTEGVTDSAKAAFETALANAKTVLDNANATQDEVNAAWDALLEGIWGLGLTQGDKSMLEQLIATAESMIPDQDKYVQDNWQMLVDTLDTAKKVAADGDAMDEDIQPAAEALLNAILAQRYKADKSILEDLINQAEGINLDGYTAESVAVFRSALALAQAVMANESLSEDDQATVDAAVATLNDAMNGLTAGGAPETTDKPEASEKPETTDKPQTTEKPETNVPQTGDTQVMGLWLVLCMGAVSCLSVMALSQRRR